jgi:hypothetical protein
MGMLPLIAAAGLMPAVRTLEERMREEAPRLKTPDQPEYLEGTVL